MRHVLLVLVAASCIGPALPMGRSTTCRPTAQDGPCDPELEQVNDRPDGYRLRGDRCEGIYVRKVALDQLSVVSLTESFEDFDNKGQPLIIEWASPGNAEVRIRARALRHRLFYQMDTARPSDRPYSWPTDLLSTKNLRRDELGIVARPPCAIGGAMREVYLPLRVRQRATNAGSQGYRLVILPGVELSEVYISLGLVGRDGRVAAYARNAVPLKFGYYPAETAIAAMVPRPIKAGIYKLEINAIRKSGGAVSTPPIWFYQR